MMNIGQPSSPPPVVPKNIQIVHQNINQTFFPPVADPPPRHYHQGRDPRTRSGDQLKRQHFRESSFSGKSTFFQTNDPLVSISQNDLGGFATVRAAKSRLMKSANLRTSGLLNLADQSIKAQVQGTTQPSQAWGNSRLNTSTSQHSITPSTMAQKTLQFKVSNYFTVERRSRRRGNARGSR